MYICPGCGKKTKQRICGSCKPKSEIKLRHIRIKICATCNKYWHKNTWIEYTELHQLLVKIFKNEIKVKGLYINPLIKVQKKPGIKKKFNYEVTLDEEVIQIPAELEITYCDTCAKQQGDYFEGVLQLRNTNEKILDYIKTYLEKNQIFVSKKKEQQKGIDLSITDQRKIQHLGHILQKKFGGLLKISPRLHTKDKQTSKNVYRVNVFYEAPNYDKGDVVKVNDKLMLISGIKGVITGVNLKDGKRISIDLKNKEYKILHTIKTTVSKIYPTVEVIDPESFQSIPIQNSKKVKQGEKVKIVNDNGLFYIV